MYLPFTYVNIAFAGDICLSQRSLKDAFKTYFEDFLLRRIQRNKF